VTTAFASYPNFFSGQCAVASNGLSFFEVTPAPSANDKRTNPIPFDDTIYYNPQLLGLHLADFAFPMQDVVNAIRKRS
jgi:hypothetical protein